MIIHATIRLFKAIPITTKRKKVNKDLLKKTIKQGYVFSPTVVYNYSFYSELIQAVEFVYGITAEKLNSSFHKSWAKIKEADVEQLIVEQLAHYLTTYGKKEPGEYLAEKEVQWGVDGLAEKIDGLADFESDRIQDVDYIYIPKEKLEIPELDIAEFDYFIDNLRLVVIKGITKKELKAKLLDLLKLGVALGEDTVDDVVEIATFLEFDKTDLEQIKNKEVKASLYGHLGLVPENPIEFLRLAIFEATESTLIIKSPDLIAKIKENTKIGTVRLFKQYKKEYGLEKLATIFYRHKPIFLAFRSNNSLKPIINKMRKLAIKHHKPMPEDFLNVITAKLEKGEEIDRNKLNTELKRVNAFRKIRLLYALNLRIKEVESIIYRIRNGKAYSTSFSFEAKGQAKKILDIVLASIIQDVNKSVKGKKIYIPSHIHYSLPATERQFTGNFPSGSYVSVSKDMIVGIHWENVKGQTDLDLSLISPSTGKIGWDASYRTEDKSILFSGDITDADGANGATELFYVKRQKKEAFILYVNYYNFQEDVEVPFKIIIAKEQAKNFKQNYMVNPNNVMSVANSKITQKEKILGLLVTTSNECRFYFAETHIGNSITASNSEVARHSRQYLFDFYEHTIGLKDVLVKAEAIMVDEKEGCDVDLSPEGLEKDSILSLLKSN